ncbi:acetoacetyl-CoA reductase [Chromobacterium sp. IIBBL 290-4]|uniref:acetoacetyl-CoA reductase n=1 Tax=Chromobacterium sp. IIBBL 290-4 TaxID=2953890 RepID=UPI0020B66E0D|nr:acetoacetyl-CoA reductase [Chromobacterium sp. IIBBL 290-4]UTH73927.1 acetoacetyl-CoA reductase [Chromobacterium sp. IIBBL 290-4]
MTKRIALVTGGMGGIGTAICKTLAEAGHTVVTTYSKPGREQAWHADMNGLGFDNIHSYLCDVTDFSACQEVAAKIAKDIGPISILVNNAGITRDASFKKQTKDDWDAVIRTNLDSVFNMTKPVLDGMLEAGFGRIVNISSINGQKGQFGQTNYSAAKAGMHGFTMALAQEVARKGVTVNTISPGYIATEMVMAVPEDVRSKIVAQIPVGRLGKPEEIAALVAFLSSDNAGFITGSNISMNGGQHMM